MFDLISEILQTLRHNKLRTALTGFAVAWGIFMLIVLLGVGNGVTGSFREQAMTPGAQKISIWPGRTSKPYHGYREGRVISLKNADIKRITDDNRQTVREVTSILYGSTDTGVYPSEIKLRDEMTMERGRFINEKDMAGRAKVIVLSKDDAASLGLPDTDEALGKQIRMSGLSFKVVGIYTSRWGREIYIPFSTARMLAGNDDDLGSMRVMLHNVETAEQGDQVEADVRRSLAAAHDFDPDDTSAVWIWNQFSQGMKGLQAMNILNASIWILGLLTLLSGVVGISNIMFVSVRERTHEIGIRRAIGAKPRSILTQIMAESIAITTLFGYIGIVLGSAATGVVDALFGESDFMTHPHVDLSIAVQVTAVLILAGALAGLFPALKSLKVKPVEALRDE